MIRLGIFARTFEGTDPGAVLRAVAGSGFSCAQYNMACSGLAAAEAPGVAAFLAHHPAGPGAYDA